MPIPNSSIILFTASVVLPIVYYIRVQKNKKLEAQRLELAEAKRQKEKGIVEAMFQEILLANKKFHHFVSYKDGYFNNNKLITWKASVDVLYNNLSQYQIESLQLENTIVSEIMLLRNNYKSGVSIRTSFNKKFIEKELKECNALLSNIEGQSLDEQQRVAVIKDEDNNLVIAGAGSGKTTTVAGKVAYVLNRFNVEPAEILLITFTKKASDEMKHRIKQKMNIDIEVNTFHSFGRKVIGEATKNMPTVIEEKQFYTEIRNIFTSLFKDSGYASKVIHFITAYRLETKDTEDFKSHGEYITYLKDNNIRPYKTEEVIIDGKRTILRETCKSFEEVQIANYLFLNGVNYKYEAPYRHKTSDNKYAQYKPDFYLPDYDIYIEHFGLIDRNNNVPSWFSSSNDLSAKDKYNSDIVWKRSTHKSYNTTLIETYSYENKEGVLLDNLKEKLESKRVVLKKRTNDEIWKILNSIAKEEVSALDTLIHTFLNLFKSNNYVINNLTDQITAYKEKNTRKRYLLFLEIFTPILTKYNEYLKSKNLIDFSDMINEAANYISKKKYKNTFKYIIIDEFQDTSIGRFNLINSLLKNNRSCKLFAVGDDWQSIYRFAGSDISLFTQFEKYFGVTEVSKIETTYRFNKKMIDISSKFILSNPNQAAKELKPFTNDSLSPIEIIQSNSFKNDDPYPLIEALKKINADTIDRNRKLNILALGRYNHFIELYKERSDLFSVNYNNIDKNYTIKYLALPHLEVHFLSVHRSKGLQGDYVILLNCVSGQYGFPSEQADDPILNLLLSKSDQFINGEERRLFYVALTRSKRKTYITTNSIYKSKFVNEIDPDYVENPQTQCPVCKKGSKIKKEGISKSGKYYIKYTCSNWNFGCDYLAWG